MNARREKLREVLLREEMSLTREVVEQAQHGDDARMDEMRERSEDLRRHQEEQRLEVVAAKRMQQYLAQCPDIRAKLVKKSLMEAKLGNLAQMADNEAIRRGEKALDKLWQEVMSKELEAEDEKEREKERKRCLLRQEAIADLAMQMAEKLALEEQKKQELREDREALARLLETVRQEELKNLEKERQNRKNLKKDLQEQVLKANRRLAAQAQRETEMDRLRQTIAAEELAKEKSSIRETSAALRQELLAYLQYLENIRKEEARRELEVDRIVEQSLKDANAIRDLARKKAKEARQSNLQAVIRGREEQLRLKCEKEKEELEQRRLENAAFDREMELEAKLAALAKEEARNRMLSYRKDLEDQRKRVDELRQREAEENKKLQLEELKQQEEYKRLTEKLLEASEDITPHPFKILLRECAARYAAEKEGHCYCPPPVSVE